MFEVLIELFFVFTLVDRREKKEEYGKGSEEVLRKESVSWC